MNIKFVCSTSGTGYWSKAARPIRLIIMEMFNKVDDETNAFGGFAELRVYFNPRDWYVNTDGYIYTDPLFLQELRANLNDFGFSPEAVDHVHYSEHGMQGKDYVSFDVCDEFVTEFNTP